MIPWLRHASLAYTIEFCCVLLAADASGLHLYVLNHSTTAAEVITALRTTGEDI